MISTFNPEGVVTACAASVIVAAKKKRHPESNAIEIKLIFNTNSFCIGSPELRRLGAR